MGNGWFFKRVRLWSFFRVCRYILCTMYNKLLKLTSIRLICSTKPNVFLSSNKVLQKGLEGLVLKNVDGIYEPGKRHWLKIKKDYLFDGKMADTADLVVIGAWFGTGKKGGMLSIFLMGCFDETRKVWKTVTKVHTGLDDAAMDKLQVNYILHFSC